MKTVSYDVPPGETIARACDTAVSIAKHGKCSVKFDFNGIPVKATPTSTPRLLQDGWNEECNRRSDAYAASPEGKRAKAEMDAKIDAAQNECNRLSITLGTAVKGGVGSVIEWLNSYVKAADWIGVDSHRNSVTRTLLDAGYKDGEHVGKPPEWFNTKKRMGRYIIGQALNCMVSGMPPHPVTLSFIEKYHKLP